MIVTRYLTKEVMSILISILLVILVIALANQVVKLLGQMAAGKLSVSIFVRLVFLYIPYFMTYLLPLSLFLAILIGYGRLYAENEMTVLFASGLSYTKFYLISLAHILLIMVLVTVTSLWLTPYAKRTRNQLQLSSDYALSIFKRITPGQLQEIPNNRGIIYVGNSKNNESTDVFIATIEPNKPNASHTRDRWDIILAKSGKIQSKRFEDIKSHYYMLHNGHIFHADTNPANQNHLSFESYGLQLYHEIPHNTSPRLMSTKELVAQRKNDRVANAELQWRLSQPMTTFVLGLLAINLCKINPRKGQFSHIIPAVMIYIIYMNALLTLRVWVAEGTIASLYWFHPTVLLLIALFNIARYPKRQLFKKFRGGSFHDS